MKEYIELLIGIGILLLGVPLGNFLSKITQEELKESQKWFKLIVLLGLIGGVIGLFIEKDSILFTSFFIAIVTSRCLKEE